MSVLNEKELERILKAFANRRRLAIIRYLKNEKQASVGDIAESIRLSLKATSKHLGILSSVDIVEKEQKSLMMFYRLSSDQKSISKHFISFL